MSEWPRKIHIRDTGLHDDLGGGGQRIFTTAGRGYEKVWYYHADEIERLEEALRKIRDHNDGERITREADDMAEIASKALDSKELT